MRFKSRNAARKARALKIRKKISGTATTPRISVFKSNYNVSIQVIDDTKSTTLCSSSTAALKLNNNNIDSCSKVAKDLAIKMKKLKISNAIFDRSGYLYHGKIKSIADTLREEGIKI